MGLGLLLCLKYVGCRGRYETRLSFYTPLCCFLNFSIPAGAPTLLRLSLLFKGVKSLYFSYSIVNFTALNLQGITSLHLLTSRVDFTSLGLTLLSLQVVLTTLLWCVTRFSALQVLYHNTTLLGFSCCQ